MGSDLHMEANNFRPRPNKAEWDKDELIIYTDQFYHGYTILWAGKVTPDNESLIKAMVKEIPPKPEPLPTYNDLLDGILNRCNDAEAVGEEAVEIALESTRYVLVKLLMDKGHEDAADLVDLTLEP